VTRKSKKEKKEDFNIKPEDMFNYVSSQDNTSSLPKEQIQFFEMCKENPYFAARNLLVRNGKPLQLAPFQRVILKDLWTKQFNMLILSRGAGKCVHGDTILFTQDGMLKLSDLSDYKGSDIYLEEKVIKLQGKDNIQETSHWYCDGIRKTKKVTTKFGYNLEGTYEHPVIVIDSNGEMKFKKIGELQVGDYVAIQRGQNYFGSKLDLSSFSYDIKSYNIPQKMSKEFARFLGYIVGDENVITNTVVGFTNIEEDVVSDYKNISYNLFGDIDILDGQTFYFLSKLIRELDMKKVVSHNKKIPKCIMQAPKNIVANFLRAYFDCSGRVEKHSVFISTASEELANQVHVVLLNFGIISSLRKTKDGYIINIYGENIEKFYREIGFGCSKKQNALIELVNNQNTNVLYSNIFWDKIETIEESENVVYDLVVPEDHTFFSNGFISHNTFLLALLCVLRACLYPREKCVIVSATYRQAQFVFDEIMKFYDESPLFRQACVKPGTKGPNSCEIQLIESGRIIAYPLGDGSKIRGARGNTLVIDEVAQVNPEIIDMVILPILNTRQDPFAKESRGNFLVYASSAYFQFNHLYERYKLFKEQVNPKSDKYTGIHALHQYSYLDMPDGWFDEAIITEAKTKLTDIQFMMEYGAMFPPDSDGFFPASLMNHCRKGHVIIQNKNFKSGDQYVFGIDPARTGDNFALTVIKLGTPNKVVALYTLNNKTFQEMHRFIRQKMRDFEQNNGTVIRIQMDMGGGGQTLRDMLSEPYAWFNDEKGQWEEEPAILEIENEDFRYHNGRRILVLQMFTPQTINNMNFDLKNDLEKNNLLLPSQTPNEDPENEAIFAEIEGLISELQTIITTPLKSGYLHFDTPKQRMKKDRYSSLLVGAEGVRQTQWVDVTPKPKELPVGFISTTFLNSRQ